MAHILVCDDETSIREFLEILLKRAGHQVRLAKDAVDCIAKLKETSADLVLTDLRLPRGSGMDVLNHIQRHMPGTQVIMMTAFATTETAVEAMKAGAYDYIIKPFKVDELNVVVARALERKQLVAENTELKAALDARGAANRLLGTSDAMKEVFDLISKVAPTKTTVLLTGESGTGKELVARAIHARGPRSSEPFVPINCGAIPETLIESELFGHTKGSFTGAHADKPGLFELAAQGTVFLDEIGELPLAMQVKLLRVLQERKVRRVGAGADIAVDCRVIAATNKNLEDEITRGQFREDLYFRLNVIQVRLPALRERKADIPFLAEAFVSKFAEQQQSPVRGITAEAMQLMLAHHWPGNVRELENVVERGVTLASAEMLDTDALPKALRDATSAPGGAAPGNALASAEGDAVVIVDDVPQEGLDLEAVLERYERRLLTRALERTGGKKKKAAQLLHVSFRSFRYRLAKLGLSAVGIGADDEDET